MCLAIPGKVVEIISDTEALVDFQGLKKKVQTVLAENIKAGDYVIVHAGFVISTLDEESAQETLGYLKELYGTITEIQKPGDCA